MDTRDWEALPITQRLESIGATIASISEMGSNAYLYLAADGPALSVKARDAYRPDAIGGSYLASHDEFAWLDLDAEATPAQIAEICGIPASTVRVAAHQGRITGRAIDARTIVYRREDVARTWARRFGIEKLK